MLRGMSAGESRRGPERGEPVGSDGWEWLDLPAPVTACGCGKTGRPVPFELQ